LINRNDIIIPKVEKLKEQLTTRWYLGMDSTQGKLQLESKQHAKAAGRVSPDRADAFVLCFYSYRPTHTKAQELKPEPRPFVIEEFQELIRTGQLFKDPVPTHKRYPTLLAGKY
jgi:hypothetical protein